VRRLAWLAVALILAGIACLAIAGIDAQRTW
jgi:hypothetical protein